MKAIIECRILSSLPSPGVEGQDSPHPDAGIAFNSPSERFQHTTMEVGTVNQVRAFEDSTAMLDTGSNPQRAQAKSKTMPFGSDSSVFSERGIAAYAPRTSGVFGIFNQTGCIFVGAAEDLEASLYSHLRGGTDESYWIRCQNPTHFAFEQCDEKTQEDRALKLIAEFNPVCNRN
jgi:hypothetical protein